MKLEPEMINKDFIGLEEANFGDNGHLNKEILGASKRGTRDNNCIGMSHEIGLKPDSQPIYQRLYTRSYGENEINRKEIEILFEKDLISPSKSTYASTVVSVKKRDGCTRFCIDYRKLNDQTILKLFPIPNMDESMANIGRA